MELTAVLPRPPISSRLLASLELDPTHPETQELMAEAQADDAKTRETLTLCPGPCHSCPCCHGDKMVSPARAAAFVAKMNSIAMLDEPGDVVDHSAPPDDVA